MHKKEFLLVKLGGSVVTLKHLAQPALRRAHLERIATALRKRYDPKKHALILIHGAGSFGHLHAHKHGLAQGTKDHPEKTYRAIENQSLDATLNAEIAALFVAAGLPVVGMPTRTFAINSEGVLDTLQTDSIRAALETGAIPLLHGDMVFDTAWGLSICSGDVLVSRLATAFHAEKVFFASDVDGIFSQDPHRFKKAVLIENVSLEEITSGSLRLDASHNIDVTGGLSKKFSTFQKNTTLKNIYFFNGLEPKNFSFLFDQSHFRGTTIDVRG